MLDKKVEKMNKEEWFDELKKDYCQTCQAASKRVAVLKRLLAKYGEMWLAERIKKFGLREYLNRVVKLEEDLKKIHNLEDLNTVGIK